MAGGLGAARCGAAFVRPGLPAGEGGASMAIWVVGGGGLVRLAPLRCGAALRSVVSPAFGGGRMGSPRSGVPIDGRPAGIGSAAGIDWGWGIDSAAGVTGAGFACGSAAGAIQVKVTSTI